MSKRKKTKKKFNKSLLAIMAIPFIALIMHASYINYPEYFQLLHVSEGKGYIDLFSYWKMLAICIIAVFMLINILFRDDKYTIVKHKQLLKIYIPMAVYGFVIILSVIFSKFTHISLVGMYERYEGGLVLLSYLIFVYYIITTLDDEDYLKYVIYSIMGVSSIIVIISILQGFGFDILTTKLFSRLIGVKGTGYINATFDRGWAYATLYNPNYLGQYSAMLFPVLIGIFAYLKKKKLKIYTGIIIILNLPTLYFSNTNTAYFSIAISIIFFILIHIKFIWKNLKLKIAFISVISIVLIGTILFISGTFGQDSIDYFDRQTGINKFQEGDIYLKDIKLIDNHSIKFVTNQFTIIMHVINANKENTYNMFFSDDNGNYIKTGPKYNKVIFFDEPYKNKIEVIYYNDNKIDLNILSPHKKVSGTVRLVYSFKDGILGMYGPGGYIVRDIEPNNMPKKLIGNEKMFSRRLYIWAVTIKNLKDNIIIGDGPDTFRIIFDQLDMIGKVNMLHSTFIVIDKPHNMYLQIAQGTGVISLIAFLLMMIFYLIWSFKIYSNIDYKNSLKVFGMMCSLGVVSFLSSGVLIDSNISVTPTFYLIYGVGIAVNIMIERKR